MIVTYSDDQQGYQHPDHVRVNDVSVPAFTLAGDAGAYPDAGEPWQPLKLYYTIWSRARIASCMTSSSSLASNRPTATGGSHGHRATTRSPHVSKSPSTTTYEPKRCWPTRHNVDPNEEFWFGLPSRHARAMHPWDDYILARSLVPVTTPEEDLFAGVRECVGAELNIR